MSSFGWHEADAETQAYDDEATRCAYATFQLNITRQELRDERALQEGVAGGEDAAWVIPGTAYAQDHAQQQQQQQQQHAKPNQAQLRAPLSLLANIHTHSMARDSSDRPMEQTMEQTLTLVRARLRAIRLNDERDTATEHPHVYGQAVVAEVGEAASLAQHTMHDIARSHTHDSVREQWATPTSTSAPTFAEARYQHNNTDAASGHPALSLAEQIRNNHKRWEPNARADQGGGDRGMASAFPSRTNHNARQEVMNRWRRRHEHFPTAANLNKTTPANNAASAGRRRRTSVANDFQGLGLGEVMQNSSRIDRRRVVASPALEGAASAQTRRRGRPRPSISDFGGSLGDCLATVAPPRSNISNGGESELGDHNVETRRAGDGRTRSSHRHASEWAGAGSLNDMLMSSSRRQQPQPQHQPPQQQVPTTGNSVRRTFVSATSAVSVDDWGGSLGDILPRNRPVEPSPHRNRNSLASNNSGSLALDPDERLVENFMAHGLGSSSSSSSSSSGGGGYVYGSRNNAVASRANFMSDSELTYEMMMAFDDNLQNRRITVAEKSKSTTPEALFKALQNASYRSKKKRKKRLVAAKKVKSSKAIKKKEKEESAREEEEEEEEDDDCAICLDKFKHRCSVKKWPCGHQFHTKCSKELLKFDTRCPLCRYDLVTGKHG